MDVSSEQPVASRHRRCFFAVLVAYLLWLGFLAWTAMR